VPKSRDVLAQANFPVISSNLYDSTKNDLMVKPYIIVQSGPVKVAIIGVITGDLKTLVIPKNF
jgi:2',3'-cyclic-nucleotide 2'-phosphodiesterase (5'-nucleotidase family)